MQKNPSNDLHDLDSVQLTELFRKAELWEETGDENMKAAAQKLKADILELTESRVNA